MGRHTHMNVPHSVGGFWSHFECHQRCWLYTRVVTNLAIPEARESSLSVWVTSFSKIINSLFGYFDPVNIYILIVKVNNFRRDLRDIPAETATLAGMRTGIRGAAGGSEEQELRGLQRAQDISWIIDWRAGKVLWAGSYSIFAVHGAAHQHIPRAHQEWCQGCSSNWNAHA